MRYAGEKDDDWVCSQFWHECQDPYDDTSVVGEERCAVPYEYLWQLVKLADETLQKRRAAKDQPAPDPDEVRRALDEWCGGPPEIIAAARAWLREHGK